MFAAPLHWLQVGCVTCGIPACNCGLSVRVVELTAIQLLESVTVKVITPLHKLERFGVLPPTLQLYVNGVAVPVILVETAPVQALNQLICVGVNPINGAF